MNNRQEHRVEGSTAPNRPSDNPTASDARRQEPSAEKILIHLPHRYPLALLIEVIKRVRTIR